MKTSIAKQKCLIFIVTSLITFSAQSTSYGLGEVIDLLLPTGGGGGGGGGINAGENCKVGDILVPGQSCVYPGTDIKFLVLNNGRGQFLSFTNHNLDASPKPLNVDVVNGSADAVHTHPMPAASTVSVNALAVNWTPWSVLKMVGVALHNA